MWLFGIFLYLFSSYALSILSGFPPTFLDTVIVSSCVFYSLLLYVLLVCSYFSVVVVLNVCWVLNRNYIKNVGHMLFVYACWCINYIM